MRGISNGVVVALLVTVIAGCQGVEPYEPEPDGLLKLDMMTVEAEVCIPTSSASVDNFNAAWATRYGPHGEGRTEGRLMVYKSTPTSTGQQVFEHWGAKRQTDVLGYKMRLAETGPVYVFFLTHAPLTAEWTGWEPPQAEATDMFLNSPLWGPHKVVPSGVAESDAPKMRFRLVAHKEVFTFPRKTADVPPPC